MKNNHLCVCKSSIPFCQQTQKPKAEVEPTDPKATKSETNSSK